MPKGTGAAAPERVDEQLEQYRRELTAYCYRMLASPFEAEDAVQETLIRAWRAHERFEGRAALRSWLYRIATNVCLDMLSSRDRRARPMDLGPAGEPVIENLRVLPEVTWVEPLPTADLAGADPADAAIARETVRLAFVAALQHLPPNQRAALILREVLGFSGREIAEALETTVAAVNSALQRARRTVDERLPDRTQQATLRTLGDQRLREVVESYMDAMARGDVDAVVSLLAEDAVWSMPPLGAWYRGVDEIAVFLSTAPLNGTWHWRHRHAQASGQAAVGSYVSDAEQGTYRAFALDVLTLRGDRIADITSFINRTTQLRDGDDFLRWPHYPADPARAAAYFEAFALPDRLG